MKKWTMRSSKPMLLNKEKQLCRRLGKAAPKSIRTIPQSSLFTIWCASAAASMSMTLSKMLRPLTKPLCLQSTDVSAALASGRAKSSVMSFESQLFKLRGR
eukprot:4794976-Heterocapsa_arctica.AAC.2